MKRMVPLPDHVRKGMGFRTLWMCQAQPFDPQDANFTFGDLPRLAQESKEHGLDEMVLWFTQDFFEVPLPPFFQHLGGEAELVKAVAECKKIGVNVALFISVKLLNRKSAGKYGVKIPPEGTHFSNFSYHPEFIPRFAPPYSDYYRVGGVSLSNPLWRSDLLASCRRLSDIGISSISWDLFSVSVATIGREIRTNARQHDAESTFSGEDVESLEFASEYLDYTWNWKGERDTQPLVNAFPAPRFNYNVDASPLDVKRCFARSQFLNVQPRKPDGVNGSDWIKNHPELSRALKQCTKLHAQFLTYFVDGTPIGDCILSRPCRAAQVCAYVLPDKVLIIVLNTGAKGEFPLACNLRPWLESASGRYLVKSFDGAGRMRGSFKNQEAGCALTTGVLDGLDIALFEILPQ